MVTPEQVDRWRREPSEHSGLEFKEARNNYDRVDLAAYCVAIANEGGGHLLLGIADRPPRRVVGSDAFRDVNQITEWLFNKIRFRIDVREVDHPDGRVVVFEIPSRPRGTAWHLDGRYLMRAGEATVAMSEDRLRAIFDEGKPDWLEERALESLNGQDIIDLLDTQTFFELMEQPYPGDRAGVLDRLERERLIDRSGDGYAVRRLGGLLLAKDLTRFTDLDRKAPRVVVYEGTSKIGVRADRIGQRGYAAGFERLVSFVMSQLPQNEILENGLRKTAVPLPSDGIRELIANALIHQDLSIGGARPMIEVFSDRVEISSPGEPLVPVERFIDGYQSRNERLADLMRRMGICEERSSGIDRVVRETERYQLPAPRFASAFRRTVATIYGPQPFEEMDRNARIGACYLHCALKHVTNERMTNGSLRERFGLPQRKGAVVSQIISATVNAGLIKVDDSVGGSRKYARYLPFWA